MKFPIDFHIGGFIIDSHLIFETFGYYIGFWLFVKSQKKQGDKISSANRAWIIFGTIAGAFLGSRLLGILDDPIIFGMKKADPLFYFSSKTIVGGLLGGLIGAEVTKKIIGEKHSSGDLLTVPLIAGMISGRIGCFLSGIRDATYGNESSLPWAMDLGDGKYRHPTSLYEITFLGLLVIGILFFSRKYELTDGSKFKIFMISYLAFRLAIEFIKPVYTFPGVHLSVIQVSCILGLLYYSKTILMPRRLFKNIS